jgi:ABC-type transporter Mla subunit MlaD
MRRTVFLTLGSLEFIVAGVLVYLACQVPGRAEVAHSFAKVERVTRRAGQQVRLVRHQVSQLRRPGLRELAGRLKAQTREVAALLKGHHVDFNTVRGLRDALAEVGEGLDGLAVTLRPAGIRRLGDGLAEMASFLEDKVAPAAAKVANQLDRTTRELRADARNLKTFLRSLPTDLGTVKRVHDGLGEFSRGLGRMDTLLRTERFKAMRAGFEGLESALRVGAGQVERLAGFTYPVLTFDDFRPEIERRKFWPDGDRIGKGLRQAAKGVKEAGKELDDLIKELPRLRHTLLASRKLVDASRASLSLALDNRARLEPLLKEMPAHAERLADELPRLGEDLARMLRDTENLREVAKGLRDARKGIHAVAVNWPEFCTVLKNSSNLLRTMCRQMDLALLHRGEYQRVMNRMVSLAEAFAVMLPYFTDQLLGQIEEEEEALRELGQSIDEVGEMVPAYGEMAGQFLEIGRFLAWLVAAIVALHGAYLVLSVKMGRRFSV